LMTCLSWTPFQSSILQQAPSQVADELGAAHSTLSSLGYSLFLQHVATDDCYF
jgi:hypothetical protein